MAVDPVSIKAYLEKPVDRTPNWKAMPLPKLQELIQRETGIFFRRSVNPPLYEHQFRTLAMALVQRQALLFLDMRTGKTRIALEYAAHFRKAGSWHGKALVIVPSPTVLDVWEEQIKEYTKFSCHLIKTTKEDAILKAVESQADFVIVSWSVLQSLLSVKEEYSKRGKPQFNAQGKAVIKRKIDVETISVLGRYFTMTIIDEIHMCKEMSSIRYQIAEIISRNHKFRLGLTGTPFGRYPLDLWPQAYLIDGGKALGGHVHFFKYAFCKKVYSHFARGSQELKFDDNKLKLLSDKLVPLTISYRLSDVREINQLSGLTKLTMRDEQLKLYDKAVAEVVAKVIEDDAQGSARARGINSFVKLRQISSGHVSFIDEEGEKRLATLPSHAKLKWLRTRIESGMDEAPFVIFYEFTASGQQIMDELKRAKLKVGWVYGKGKENGKHIRDFQNGKLNGLVVNPKSGGIGIDLWPADYIYFYECPVSPIIRAQAEARPFGPKRGNRPVVVEDVIAGKIEDRVYGFVKEGKELLARTIHRKRDLLNWFS